MSHFLAHFFNRACRLTAGIFGVVFLTWFSCVRVPVFAALGDWSTLASVPGIVGVGANMVHPGSGDFIYLTRGDDATGFYKYNISNNAWTTLAVVPGAVGAGAKLLYPGSGDFIYLAKGATSTGFYKYSISNDAWTTLAVVPGNVGDGGSMVYPGSGDFIYLARSSTGFYKYSLSNDAWTTLAVVPGNVGAGGNMIYPGSGDFIYMARGNGTTGFYKYSLSNDVWTTLAVVPGGVGFGGNVVYPGSGDFIYVIKGVGSTEFYKYSISNDAWTTLAVVPNTVGYGGSLAYPGSGNGLYLTRGVASTGFYKYNLNNDSWTTMAVAPNNFFTGGNLFHPGFGDHLYAVGGGRTVAFLKYEFDATAPSGGVVVDNGQYTSINDSISASWQSFTDNGTITYYSYSAYILQDGSSLVAPTTTSNTSVDEPFFAINDGSTIVFQVQAVDSFSNSSSIISSNGITVDTTTPTTGTVTDDGVYSGSATTLSASWNGFSDGVSGIAEYSYSIGTSAGDTSIRNWTSAGANTTVNATGLTLVHGTRYFINVRVKDQAGNLSSVASSNGITVDTVRPTQGNVATPGEYLSNSSTLSFSWSDFSDALSGIAEYSYMVSLATGGITVDWTSAGLSTSALLTGLTLSNGEEYLISVRARDNAGNVGHPTTTGTITVDTTGPATGSLRDEGTHTTNTSQLSLSWQIQAIPAPSCRGASGGTRRASCRLASSAASVWQDAETNLNEFSYSIGTSAGATDVLTWTQSNIDLHAAYHTILHTGLTLINGQTYFFNLRAINDAGVLSEVVSSDGIMVDITAPTTGTVVDDGTYTSSSTQLSASWPGFSDAESGILEFSYSIGTSVGDTSVRDWTSVGTATRVTATGLTLSSGTQYFFNIRAMDAANNSAQVVSSNGISVDDAVPTAGSVSDSGQYTASADTLYFTWTGFSDNTAIATYEYSIGSTTGGTNIRDWTSTGNGNGFLAIGLSLNSGAEFFINLRAKDEANNISSHVSTNGITVDTAAPTAGVVTDEGTNTGDDSQLVANLSGFVDGLSGIAEYSYSIGTSAGDVSVKNWTSNGDNTNISATGLQLVDQQTYFFNVRAKDNVGNIGAVISSDGIQYLADQEAPTAGSVSDSGQYTASADTLFFNWTGFTDNTAIATYEYSIGNTAGGANIRDWTSAGNGNGFLATGLSLSSGTQYFVNLRAKDGGNHSSSIVSTDGIIVDTSAPTGGTVADEGSTTENGSQLAANLSGFVEGLSGIAEYSYSIGTSAGDDSIKAWTSNGSSTHIIASDLQLVDQQTYVFNVKAKDGAGNIGEVVSSDGIKFVADTNGPTAGTVTDEGARTKRTSQLSASWSGFADASGIAEYSYSIGTSGGNDSVKGWTSAGTNTGVLVTGLTLNYGSIYFFNVRAKDAFGNLSAVASSDGIFVETVSGDMDQDGDIDLQDAILANKSATGAIIPTEAQIHFADVAEPKDGKITSEDANLILRCAKGKIRGNLAYLWCPAIVAPESAVLNGTISAGGRP